MDLKDLVALVTGVSKGIGRATIVRLARRGTTAAIACRSADRPVQEVQAEIAALGAVSPLRPFPNGLNAS